MNNKHYRTDFSLRIFALSVFFIVTMQLGASAQVTMPRFFSDHMVLKSDTSTLFWGWTNPGKPVLVKASWLKDTLKTVSSGTSRWSVKLPTTAAGGPYTITVISEGDTLGIQDVLMGEVWICSGQSNMQRSAVQHLKQMLDVLKGPYEKNIRVLNIRNIASPLPQEDIYDRWSECDAASLKPFTAIGYFFAKKISSELKVPVGIINASWGGTSAEVWLPAGEVLTDTFLARKALLQITAPRKPNLPGQAWNAMVAPYVGYAISGALWYQGENNTVSWDGYARLFTKLIESWRNNWNTAFPFLFAQIAPYNYKNKTLQKGALVREAQNQVSIQLPGVGMVLTSDLVDNINDIHPSDKKTVALRLANLALSTNYHKLSENRQSPVYKSYKIIKDSVVISFYHMGNEKLMVKGDVINDLYIAGEDRKFQPANYKLEGDKLIVFNEKIKHPVSVRYAFSDTALTNLYSTNGLPVSLFRLDTWNNPVKF